MAGPLSTLFAGIVLAQAGSPPAGEPPAGAPPAPPAQATAEPTTRFGEACVVAARRTLSPNFEFKLKSVEDNTATGKRDLWLEYDAVRLDQGATYAEIYGCLFTAVDNPAEIVLEGAATTEQRLGPDAVAVLNQVLVDAGFATRRP